RELERRGYPVWRSFGCSAIDFARSRLATQALSQGFAETLWIDADIVFDPDEVERLRRWTLADIRSAGANAAESQAMGRAEGEPYSEPELPLVVTGVYAKKGLRELAVQMVVEAGATLHFGLNAPFQRAIYAPGGMLLIRRPAYEMVAEACQLPHCTTNEAFGMIPFFMPMIIQEGSQSIYLCEDFAFSRRLRDVGIDIWIDMQIRLYHLGSYPYSWEDAGKAVERYASYRFVFQPKSDGKLSASGSPAQG
ncbi:MAG: hypothetical protein ABI557_14660, partial [Aureliella sp.]